MADDLIDEKIIARQSRDQRPWQKNIEPDKNHLFTMYISPADKPGSASTIVKARVSEAVVFSIGNQYGPLFETNKDSAIGALFQLTTGRSLAVQEASRQVWKGSTTGTFSFEIQLIALNDPKTEVVDQVKALYKLASPSGAGKAKTFTEKLTSSLLKPPGLINIDIPNVLSLTNFYLQSVNFSQVLKLMRSKEFQGQPKGPSLPLSATGQIEVVPEYMFLQEDIDFVFLGGTNES